MKKFNPVEICCLDGKYYARVKFGRKSKPIYSEAFDHPQDAKAWARATLYASPTPNQPPVRVSSGRVYNF